MDNSTWQNFLIAAQGGEPERVPVALTINSSFVPGFVGLNTVDFFMYPARWLRAHLALAERFPHVVFTPGFWVEYGAANEASALGAAVLWRHDGAPAIHPLELPPTTWDHLRRPDPFTDGLMALAVRRYWNLEKNGELPDPYRIHFVAARGPFSIAAHLFGSAALLDALTVAPDHVLTALDILTDTTIRFLQAQLGCLREPVGILLLDDTVGMLTASQFGGLAKPILQRIFHGFEGLIRIFHNNTPCRHLLPHLNDLDFEVYQFSHLMDIVEVRAALKPSVALMGGLAPLEHLARGMPSHVESAARACLARVGRSGVILSVGGSVAPATPPENIDALVRATLP